MKIRSTLTAALAALCVGGAGLGGLAVTATGAAAAPNGTITTVVGLGIASSTGDGGPASAATISQPYGTAYDLAGNLYVADFASHRVRRISPAGIITTYAGTGTAGNTGDGGAATVATLHSPQGVATDAAGNLYIADSGNNRIRKVSPAGVITAFAGTGTQGDTGDGGPANAANVYTPSGVAVDAQGRVLFTEGSSRIRRVDTNGVITTIAGTISGFSGDGGPGTTAKLFQPASVAIDRNQNIVIADLFNNRVRRIDHVTGIITTIVGNGAMTSTGDGGPAGAATVYEPWGLAVDGAGNVYISPEGGSKIRKISAATGTITTVAGNGVTSDTGDGGPATAASVGVCFGLAISPTGDLVIADSSNQRVRSVQGIADSGQGYYLAASDGGVFTHGSAKFFGSEGALKLAKPIVTMATTPTHLGYWLFATDGGVFTHGDAGFFGSEGALKLAQPIVAAATTPSGNGYWLFASDGGVFTHGDAAFYGSEGALKLNKPIVAAAATPSGNGYWLFASDGGVFTHGDAAFYGSEGALKLVQPVVSAASSPSGKGYWLFAADGGAFTHGDAAFYGSEGALKLNKPIVASAATKTGRGYWLVASDGGVFTHGDAGFFGSEGALKLVQPVVAASAS